MYVNVLEEDRVEVVEPDIEPDVDPRIEIDKVGGRSLKDAMWEKLWEERQDLVNAAGLRLIERRWPYCPDSCKEWDDDGEYVRHICDHRPSSGEMESLLKERFVEMKFALFRNEMRLVEAGRGDEEIKDFLVLMLDGFGKYKDAYGRDVFLGV